MTSVPETPTECSFCRMTAKDLCVCHRVDDQGKIYTGALCRSCVRTFLFDWAYTDPEYFEQTVKDARDWRPEDQELEPKNPT